MLTIENINKSFGSKQVLFGIETEISKGEIVGILGPNGAGKSTLMRIITGYFFPDSGDVKIGNESIFSDNSLKKKIGYLPEVNPLYEDMGVDEFLSFTADLKGVENSTEAIDKVLKMAGLSDKKLAYINTLSKGYRQRVGLAAALIGDPEILILDEPTEGLDPNQRDEIQTLIRELGKQKTILISSHVLSELSSLVSRVIIISEGKIKLDDTLDNIQKSGNSGKIKIHIVFQGHIDTGSVKEAFPDIVDIVIQGQKMQITSNRDIMQELLAHLAGRYQIVEFFSEKISLSDVFFDTIK